MRQPETKESDEDRVRGSSRFGRFGRLLRSRRFRRFSPDGSSAYALLAVIAAVVFIPAFSAGFVWDDSIIVDLPESVNGFGDIWFNPSLLQGEGHYWPVVYTTFWIEYQLWGLDPMGYHIVNVALHALNTMLVYALLRRLKVPGAWFAAAVFAVHPVHVDSVAWTIERKDVLSALFYLAAALLYFSWDHRRNPENAHDSTGRGQRRGRGSRAPGSQSVTGRELLLYTGSVIAFTLSMLSKSIGVTLPVMLLVYHWWRNGRISRREAAQTLPFFGVSAAITIGDLAYYTPRAEILFDLSLTERVQVVARSFWHYVEKLVWPADLLPLYPRWDVEGTDPLGWALFATAAGVTLGLWFLRGRIGRGPLAGWLFFGVTLAPVLGILDHGYMGTAFVADRFQYLAGVGLIALIVGPVAYWAVRWPFKSVLKPAHVLITVSIVVLFVLGSITWDRASNYRDSITFFTFIVSENPQAKGGAYNNLGLAYVRQGRLDDGIEAYLQSLVNDDPDIAVPLNNLGAAYFRREEFDNAEKYLRQSLDYAPSYVSPLFNLSNMFIYIKNYTKAEKYVKRALDLAPYSPPALSNAAELYDGLGNQALAEQYYGIALEKHPGNVQILGKYGLFLKEQGRLAEAEPILRRALAVDSANTDVAQALGSVLLSLDRTADAAALVEEGYLRSLGPATAEFEVNRGNALLEAGQFSEAADAYTAAIEADPELVAAHVQLGVAYENLDRGQDALNSYRRAYGLDEENISAVFYLALLAARGGLPDEALGLFNEAESLFERDLVPLDEADAEIPKLIDVYINRSVVLVYLGRLDDALADTDRALEIDPSHELAGENRENLLGLIGLRDEETG